MSLETVAIIVGLSGLTVLGTLRAALAWWRRRPPWARRPVSDRQLAEFRALREPPIYFATHAQENGMVIVEDCGVTSTGFPARGFERGKPLPPPYHGYRWRGLVKDWGQPVTRIPLVGVEYAVGRAHRLRRDG